MRLILCEESSLAAYEISNSMQIFWTPRPLKLTIVQIGQGIRIEIEGGFLKDGSHCFEMCSDSARMIYGQDFQVTCIFQKYTRRFQRYALSKKNIYIGRDRGCDIVYCHPTVSKKHCLLQSDENGDWLIQDLKSMNGLYLDGKRIDVATLKNGNCLAVCGFEIWYSDCFLYMMIPDFSQLDIFVPAEISFSEEQQEVFRPMLPPEQPCKAVNEPKKGYSFSLKDTLLMLVFPLMMVLQNSRASYHYAYAACIVAAIRLADLLNSKISSLKKKKKAEKEYQAALLGYHQAMQEFYPDCLQLEKRFLSLGGLMTRNTAVVRLGLNETGNVILHDFGQYPHLVIKGNKTACGRMIKQIVYQLCIYDPKTALVLECLTDDYCFCTSLQAPKEKVLWIGRTPISFDDSHFWIEPITDFWQSAHGYSALVDLDEKYYLTEKRNVLLPDAFFDAALFSHHYAKLQCNQTEQQKKTYLQMLQLDCKTILEIRSQYMIDQQLTGYMGNQRDVPLYLDLHEKKDGPHLLVAGMTGSGKSEWLMSYLFSLAVFYDSQDVQFFFIDFKGGGLSQIFERLAHTAMVLTDLEPLQISRAVAALEDEVKQREKLLLEAARTCDQANLSIHDLKRLHRYGKTSCHLAHLIVVVDEFAELKALYPEMLQSLVRIARVGRSLGIHLILSTQRPGGVVDAQILSNIKSKIVLKVAAKQDSYELLANSDAAFLKEPGEFYCQKEAQGSLIYGRAQLILPADPAIIFLDIDRKERGRLPLPVQSRITFSMLTERINSVTQSVLPLYFKDFIKVPDNVLQQGCLGVYDDYRHRQMPLLYHDFSQDGPLLVIGADAQTLQIFFAHYQGFISAASLPLPKELPEKLVLENFTHWYMYDYELLDRLLSHCSCLFIEKDVSNVKMRFFEKFSQCLVFDRQMAEKLLGCRILWQCDAKRHIGILVRKGVCYRCQIQSAF